VPDALPDHERIGSARVIDVVYLDHPRSHQPQRWLLVKMQRT
jgi:hypothetical protein